MHVKHFASLELLWTKKHTSWLVGDIEAHILQIYCNLIILLHESLAVVIMTAGTKSERGIVDREGDHIKEGHIHIHKFFSGCIAIGEGRHIMNETTKQGVRRQGWHFES